MTGHSTTAILARVSGVLIVDDNPLVRELLTQLLEDEYELRVASNGALGVAAAEEAVPDIILMDLTMPVMDGWTAIARLREQWATCRVPIIALSAVSDEGEIQRALDAGANRHLTKPIDQDELLRVLEHYTGDRRTSGVRRRDVVQVQVDAFERQRAADGED